MRISKRKFIFFGKKAEYPTLSWYENFMGGHITFGKTTIYGCNAMCWAVNIHTKKWGYVCFTLPSINRLRRREGMYFYLSPNATPQASTLYIGRDKEQKKLSVKRRKKYGHNFDAWNIDYRNVS